MLLLVEGEEKECLPKFGVPIFILAHKLNKFYSLSLKHCTGVKFLLSERLSQDPLGSFFGKQRMRGGYSDNPSVRDFLYGTSSLVLPP